MRQFNLSISLCAIVCLVTNFTHGQSVGVADKEITWHSSELTDKNYSKRIVSPYRLVTHGRTSMDLHRGNEQTLTFTILSVKGDWGNEKEEGMLEYNVLYSTDALGKVTLERKGSAVKARVDFTQKNPNALNVEFIIDAVE